MVPFWFAINGDLILEVLIPRLNLLSQNFSTLLYSLQSSSTSGKPKMIVKGFQWLTFFLAKRAIQMVDRILYTSLLCKENKANILECFCQKSPQKENYFINVRKAAYCVKSGRIGNFSGLHFLHSDLIREFKE